MKKKLKKTIRFDIVTLFPAIFDSYLHESLLKRAREKKLIEVVVHDVRDFTSDRHHKVDDRPFGGGPGMVLQLPPLDKAVRTILKKKKKSRVILFGTRGKKFDATTAKRLMKYDQLVLICGRYEGVDERVAEHIADEEISIGDFVLSGGELPALVLLETVSRYIPGFLGKYESLEDVNGSFPTYTRPADYSPKKGVHWKVPNVLLSGDHKKIASHRKRNI